MHLLVSLYRYSLLLQTLVMEAQHSAMEAVGDSSSEDLTNELDGTDSRQPDTHRQDALHDFVTTPASEFLLREQNYAKCLSILIESYLKPYHNDIQARIVTATSRVRGSVARLGGSNGVAEEAARLHDELEDLLGELLNIMASHETLLRGLREAKVEELLTDADSQHLAFSEVCRVLRPHIPMFRNAYSNYIAKEALWEQLLTKEVKPKLSASVAFGVEQMIILMRDSEPSLHDNDLGLTSLMKLPVKSLLGQRLLLEEGIKAAQKQCVDLPAYASETMEELRVLCQQMDFGRNIVVNQERLASLEKQFNIKGLHDDEITLHWQGAMWMGYRSREGSNAWKLRPCHVILCGTHLYVVKLKKEDGKAREVARIALANIEDVRNDGDKRPVFQGRHALQLRFRIPPKPSTSRRPNSIRVLRLDLPTTTSGGEVSKSPLSKLKDLFTPKKTTPPASVGSFGSEPSEENSRRVFAVATSDEMGEVFLLEETLVIQMLQQKLLDATAEL